MQVTTILLHNFEGGSDSDIHHAALFVGSHDINKIKDKIIEYYMKDKDLVRDFKLKVKNFRLVLVDSRRHHYEMHHKQEMMNDIILVMGEVE